MVMTMKIKRIQYKIGFKSVNVPLPIITSALTPFFYFFLESRPEIITQMVPVAVSPLIFTPSWLFMAYSSIWFFPLVDLTTFPVRVVIWKQTWESSLSWSYFPAFTQKSRSPFSTSTFAVTYPHSWSFSVLIVIFSPFEFDSLFVDPVSVQVVPLKVTSLAKETAKMKQIKAKISFI